MPETFSTPGAGDVTPAEKKRLKGLLAKYGNDFTQCVKDQKKHGLSDDHAKRRCAVLKDVAQGTTKWRSGGKKKK
jgi:hypothetical protein